MKPPSFNRLFIDSYKTFHHFLIKQGTNKSNTIFKIKPRCYILTVIYWMSKTNMVASFSEYPMKNNSKLQNTHSASFSKLCASKQLPLYY